MTTKLLLAVACLGSAIGFAQTSGSTLHVNLQHDTQVGKVSLPAGQYSIKEVNSSVIEITSQDPKGPNTFAMVTPVVAPKNAVTDHPKVILHEGDNGSYRLQSIWMEGQDVGFEVAAE
jgi:hypothetical protein